MVSGIEVHRWAMDQLFETGGGAHASRPLPFPPQPKIPPLREPAGQRACRPLNASPAPDCDLTEFVHGASLIGFVPSDHQRRFARIMEARRPDGRPRHRRSTVTEPRRSGKTDGIWALVIGRCTSREDYHAAYSAQTGAKGRKRFLSLAQRLERWDPCPRASRNAPDGCTRDHVHYHVYRSNGGERIEWTNGSTLDVLPPDPENYRGDEYDLVILDEAQEITEDDVADELLGGINPTMDTVPDAQLVVAGTAGKMRSGLLWSSLVKGRAGTWGILEYAAPDHADPHEQATWLAAHPGIGTLTTLDVIAENYEDLSLLDFQREYLGQWPADASVSAIDPVHWAAGEATAGPRPARVGLAFDVAPDGSNAALCCAWRDSAGVAYVEVLAFRAGVGWLAGEAHRVALDARAPVAYDSIGANTNPANDLVLRRPAVRTTPMNLKDVQGAAQRIVSELAAGRIRHFDQKDLNLAVAGAAWRSVGESGRAFGHKASSSSIAPLTAAALALWAYDKTPARHGFEIVTVVG